jgi:hypothetical protein
LSYNIFKFFKFLLKKYFFDVYKKNQNEQQHYMDLIINYNNIIYDNENGLENIRAKVIALNEYVNTQFELKNNYNDKEKEEIKNIYEQLMDSNSSMYDKSKTEKMGQLFLDYGENHFIFNAGLEMIKPLGIVTGPVVDRNGKNIIITTIYDNISDEKLLNALNKSMKKRLVSCKICQSFTGVMDKKLFIPFCDYKC